VCVWCSIDRSIDHLLCKWNLHGQNVPLSQFSSVHVFNVAEQSEIQHDERSFQMLVIMRPNTWLLLCCTSLKNEEWHQLVLTAAMLLCLHIAVICWFIVRTCQHCWIYEDTKMQSFRGLCFCIIFWDFPYIPWSLWHTGLDSRKRCG